MPPADTLSPLLAAGRAVRRLAADEALFNQGDPAVAIYQVESGRLRLVRRTSDDHRVILYTARSGEFFAEASLFAETYRCDAVAAAPSRVRVYPKAEIMALLRAEPALAEAFMARLAHQLQELRTRMELRNIRSARERLLQYLRLRAGKDGRSVRIDGQLQDIAAEIGISREALYRTLSTLVSDGSIVRTRTAIVLDKPA
jgi:CRP-like cAMP-binding protein